MTETPPTRSAAHNLLLVARDLGPPGEPFDLADLVLAAWRAFPEQFGLRGRVKESASDNTVATFVMGKRGCVRRGLFAKAGPKQYTLTPAGLEVTATLDAGKKPRAFTGRPARHVNFHHGDDIDRMLQSRAYSRFAAGQAVTITWDDALAFWAVSLTESETGHGMPFYRRLASRLETVAKAIAGAAGGCRVGGRDVSAFEVGVLGDLDSYLRDAMSRQLKRAGVAT